MLTTKAIKTNLLRWSSIACVFFFQSPLLYGQSDDTTVSRKIHTVTAGKKYYRSSFHQFLWGKHYRKEWKTPVTVPVFYLDSVAGGLKPYEAGGGRQSKSLRLRSGNDKEYVLRSIDKSYGKALPEIYRNTFIERIINDQVTTGHPYSALTIPGMADAAKIYHTYPSIVYVPAQPRLDSFNKEFGNTLYLFEQRADENWEEASNFGHSKNIIGTEKLRENLLESNERRIDQLAYVRARLFDMLIGDWGRHEDQWRWASFKEKGITTYRPIPRDRDQAYTKFDGALTGIVISIADLNFLQSFGPTIKDVNRYNFPARNLDRRMANEPTLDQWVAIAKDLQQSLSDSVIDQSIRQMPPEVYPFSGKEISDKIKSRRDKLVNYATDYYKFLAQQVQVPGSEKDEYFEVTRMNDHQTKVTVYSLNKGKKENIIYSRIFDSGETQEIRLFGVGGHDVFTVSGKASSAIHVRIIGGPEKDEITDKSDTRGKTVSVYDNHNNKIVTSRSTRLNLSNDPDIHKYDYKWFEYSEKGISQSVFYSNADRFYIGIGYEMNNHKWRREPYANNHELDLHYSLSQKAFSLTYEGTVNQFIGKWNLGLYGNYDFVRWTNFFGRGNETKRMGSRDYHIMRTREAIGQVGLNRMLGKKSKIELAGFYQQVKIIEDNDRFVGTLFFNGGPEHLYDMKHFAGGIATYSYQDVDDKLIPSRGIYFTTSASYTRNVQTGSNFGRYTANLNLYIPLLRNLILATRSGASTMNGEAEFYQLNSIGGNRSLRGYRRDRFRGESAVFSDQELQWLFNVKSHLFNGKLGLLGLYDIGRVWYPGENSNTWHTGYGGGIIIAPFNKVMFSVSYAMSNDENRIHFRCVKPLPL